MRLRTLVGLLAVLGVAALAAWPPLVPQSPSPEQLVLLRRLQTLRALAVRAGEGPLLAASEALIAVDQHLLQDLLSSVLPMEREAGGYRVRVESAVAQFEDGLALVRFDARATPAGTSSSFVQLRLFAGVDRVELEPRSGELRARLTVFAVDAPQVRLAGRATELAGVVAAVGPAALEAIASWMPVVPVPLTFAGELALPAAVSDTVRIPATSLPLAFAVRDVAVFRGRLWASLGERSAGEDDAALRPRIRPAGLEPTPTLLALASSGCSRERRQAAALAGEGTDLRGLLAAEAARFEQRLAADPLVAEALRVPSQVAVVLRPSFVESIVGRAAAAYLHRVEVDLRRRSVSRAGEERRRTPFGTRRVGRWRARVDLDGVRATVGVGKPAVRLGAGNTIALRLPVRAAATSASVRATFSWRSEGVANLVCRDFDVDRRLAGVIPELRDELSGGFVLASDGSAVTARPYLDDRRLRIGAAPSERSWEDVRQVLERQDTLLRCGLGLDPDRVLRRLRALVARGFRVELPRDVLRPVLLPGRFSDRLRVADREVRLIVSSTRTSVDAHGLWVRAEMHARHASAPHSAAD